MEDVPFLFDRRIEKKEKQILDHKSRYTIYNHYVITMKKKKENSYSKAKLYKSKTQAKYKQIERKSKLMKMIMIR